MCKLVTSAAYFLHLHFKVYYSTLSFTRRLAFPLPYPVLLNPLGILQSVVFVYHAECPEVSMLQILLPCTLTDSNLTW